MEIECLDEWINYMDNTILSNPTRFTQFVLHVCKEEKDFYELLIEIYQKGLRGETGFNAKGVSNTASLTDRLRETFNKENLVKREDIKNVFPDFINWIKGFTKQDSKVITDFDNLVYPLYALLYGFSNFEGLTYSKKKDNYILNFKFPAYETIRLCGMTIYLQALRGEFTYRKTS